jgi:lyso-ornithine lipid O-acyltransferase
MGLDLLVRPAQTAAEGAERIHRYCRKIVAALGVTWSFEGEIPSYGAVVSNHLSYVDILLYASIRPFVMVAKREVRGWPGIGWLTSRAGTVYVVRGGSPDTYPAVNRAMAEAYRSGLPVLFFPEGTTTDGSEILPFRRGLFHSVLNEQVPLNVAAVSYATDDEKASIANDVCWWGDATLAPHIVRLTGTDGVRARVRFGGEITERGDRFVLSQQARRQIAAMYAELTLAESGAKAGSSSASHESELAQAH